MSDNRLSYGFMIPLLEKVDYEETADFLDSEYGAGRLQINYEGTILFSDYGNREDAYGGIFFIDGDKLDEFLDDLDSLPDTIKPDIERGGKSYVSYWYDGADSYMSELTLEELNEGKLK